ncbi:MAG: transcriptional repressor [Candidatus Eremiobacteraeota bacterium]|nr:transcriptional repressor [Candidatus Eremiobacteraeota bacterium]
MGRLKSLRLPGNYELIYSIVLEHGVGTHLTTGEVYVKAKRRQSAIGYSTVYRGLRRLRDAGRISEIVAHGEAAVYEPVGPEHAHFFCTKCRKLRDVEFKLPKNLVLRVAQLERATITGASLTLEGICAGCRPSADPRVAARPSALLR